MGISMIRRAPVQQRANHLKWLRRYTAVVLMFSPAVIYAFGPYGWGGPFNNMGNGLQPYAIPWGSPYPMTNPFNSYRSPWSAANPLGYGQYPGWSQMGGWPYNGYSGYPTQFYRGPYGRVIGGVSPNGDFWFNMTFGGNSGDLYDFLTRLQASGYLRMNLNQQNQGILNQVPDVGLSPLPSTNLLGL